MNISNIIHTYYTQMGKDKKQSSDMDMEMEESMEQEHKQDLGGDSSEQSEEQAQEEVNLNEKKTVTIQQSEQDEGSATYQFTDEDHTLGNALRYMLMRIPDTEFCGYSIPHPSENKLNLRLQTTGRNSNEVLLQGFSQLDQVMAKLHSQFNAAVLAHK